MQNKDPPTAIERVRG